MGTIVFPSGYAVKKGWRTKFEHLQGVNVSYNSIETTGMTDLNLVFLAEAIMDDHTRVSPDLMDLFVRRYNELSSG